MNFSPEKYPFQRKIQIRFSDIDLYQHVNNVSFLEYAEDIRVQFLYGLSQKETEKHNTSLGWVLVHSEIDYKKQVFFSDELLGGLKVIKIGNTSLTMGVDFWKKKKNTLEPAAFSQYVVCAFDYKKQTTVPIPDTLKKNILSLEN